MRGRCRGVEHNVEEFTVSGGRCRGVEDLVWSSELRIV